ncbi:hypothetical protein AZSI13_31330 [Azospira sp. I13]|uniref:hypothetical protein n=1 Tax=Azospira sp. I13 TaxID=1765050 RepID=UPI000D4FDE70|nr:hypothetical protein [Azospira sp. I13]GBG03806.1 hypothetical protein AZSI13_31330 [Azospira sp. I13]
MARSRNLKPGFFKNETLAECSPLARILFAGLWCLADRAGRLEDRPKRIRAEVLPYDDGSVDDMLNELHKAGFILRYRIDGQGYIQVLNFDKHQNPHHREQESEIPAPSDDMGGSSQASDKPQASPGLASDKPGTSRADSLLLIPDSLNPITTTSPAGDPLACPVEEIVSLYHEAMPTNPRCKVLNSSRRGSIKARWLEAARLTCKPFGYSSRADGLAAWRTFFETCSESAFLTGRTSAQPGKPPFLADIDFLMSASGFAKCLENKYHREAA